MLLPKPNFTPNDRLDFWFQKTISNIHTKALHTHTYFNYKSIFIIIYFPHNFKNHNQSYQTNTSSTWSFILFKSILKKNSPSCHDSQSQLRKASHAEGLCVRSPVWPLRYRLDGYPCFMGFMLFKIPSTSWPEWDCTSLWRVHDGTKAQYGSINLQLHIKQSHQSKSAQTTTKYFTQLILNHPIQSTFWHTVS